MMSPGLDGATPGYQMSSPTHLLLGRDWGLPFTIMGPVCFPEIPQAKDQERKSEPRYTWAGTHATSPEWGRAVGLYRSV